MCCDVAMDVEVTLVILHFKRFTGFNISLHLDCAMQNLLLLITCSDLKLEF